ncbi:MAG: radical SAM protein [Euryarchaeota archaeon]|nr:radical SAM protein [Euryarchaeota archaeon]
MNGDQRLVKPKLLLKVDIENGRKAIFSNLTGSAAVMDSEVEEILDSFESPVYLKDVCKNDPLCEKAVNELLSEGMLIEEGIDEYSRVKDTIDKIRRSRKYSFMFVLTTRCNFNCIYCYEDKTPLDMTWRTAEKCIDFIEDRVKETGQKNVNISPYGGEPLLKFDLIKRILNTLRERLPDTEITTSIITNGSLLTEERAEFLRGYNCKFVQITIDGPKRVHDKRRPYKNGSSSFEDVVRGLKVALDNIERVSLRINVDKNNVKHVQDFLEYLNSNNINKPNMNVSFGKTHATTKASMSYKKHCIPLHEWGKEFIKLFKLSQEMGFKSILPLPRFLYCRAYIKNDLMFNPDGNLVPCLEAAGNCPEEFIVGNIFDDPVYNSNADKFFKRSPLDFEKCRNCDIIAFCGGGCIPFAYAENDTLNSVSCPFYKYIFKDMAEIYIQNCLSDKSMYRKVDFNPCKI